MPETSSPGQHAGTSHHGGHGHDTVHDDEPYHGGVGKYLLVFLALCVLTTASFFTVSPLWPYHDTPAVGWTFMMAVSSTKAMLVISFFMHLIWEANWKYVLTIPATIMSIFLVLMLVPDIGGRTENYSGARWLHAAQPRPASHASAGHGETGDEHGEGEHGEGEHGEGEQHSDGGAEQH